MVKVYNATRQATEEFDSINEKLYTSAWKSQFLSGLMMPLMGFIGNLGYVAVCVVGAYLTMKGHISFGVIVAFTLYIRLFTQPLNQIAQAANNLQRTGGASERVFAFLEEEELEDESHKTKELTNVQGDVEFRHGQFGYEPGKPIIKDFSLKVEAGQKIAIVGPTGAGKTTLVNLIMRFYELDGGEILLDGIPISEVSRENVHEQFCMVLQDTWLFEGTIKENIIYAKDGVTFDMVREACRLVGMDYFIRSLPKGYDTVLNDKTTLSAGQKQLLTIAHRLSTIRNADLILVMKDGDILEMGTHEDLLKQEGFYADLYQSQFSQTA